MRRECDPVSGRARGVAHGDEPGCDIRTRVGPLYSVWEADGNVALEQLPLEALALPIPGR